MHGMLLCVISRRHSEPSKLSLQGNRAIQSSASTHYSHEDACGGGCCMQLSLDSMVAPMDHLDARMFASQTYCVTVGLS